MAMIHDWHKPEDSGLPASAFRNSEVLQRVEPDGSLHLRFVNAKGDVLSIAFTASETDKLAEFLWTDRK